MQVERYILFIRIAVDLFDKNLWNINFFYLSLLKTVHCKAAKC